MRIRSISWCMISMAWILLPMVGCGPTAATPTTEITALTPETYAVYSAVLDARLREMGGERVIALENETMLSGSPEEGGWYDNMVRSRLSEGDQETWEDLLQKNQPLPLEDRFSLTAGKVFLGEYPSVEPSDEAWGAFRAEYGVGLLVSLSRVGFNTQMDGALVMVATGCGPTCGEVSLIFVAKANGEWSQREKIWVLEK